MTIRKFKTIDKEHTEDITEHENTDLAEYAA